MLPVEEYFPEQEIHNISVTMFPVDDLFSATFRAALSHDSRQSDRNLGPAYLNTRYITAEVFEKKSRHYNLKFRFNIFLKFLHFLLCISGDVESSSKIIGYRKMNLFFSRHRQKLVRKREQSLY